MIKDIHNRGFIALISAILISVALLTLVVAVSFEGFFGRFNILDSQTKETSIYLAEACVNTAILLIAQDEDYVGEEECVEVGDNQCACDIRPIIVSGTDRIIEAQASSSGMFTNLQVRVDASDDSVPVESWVEVANF